MTRRITATIGVRRYLESVSRDAHGNLRTRHADPVPLGVYAFYPATSTEPDEPGRRAVLTGRTVLAPITAEGQIGPHDLVDGPDGRTYEVIGTPGPWKHNPHARIPGNEGLQIELRRTEG